MWQAHYFCVVIQVQLTQAAAIANFNLPEPVLKQEAHAAAAPAALKVLDPCLPRGYEGELEGVRVSGGGYFSLCRQITAGLVLGNCSAMSCSLAGFSLPPLTGKRLPQAIKPAADDQQPFACWLASEARHTFCYELPHSVC